VRNVAFGIVLSALALLQVAVVAAVLGMSESHARYVLASTETERKASTL
jgi:hypothetical protein